MRITLNPNQMNKMCAPVIGYEAENRVTEFEFDYSDWAADLGEGTLTLAVQRPTDTIPYPVTLTQTGENKATWAISETDLAIVGRGEFQLSYIVDEKVKKSAIYEVLIDRSLEPTGDVPDPYISWFEQIIAVGAQATQDANRAEAAADSIKDLTAEANTLDAGSDATAEYDAETGVMTFGIPRGEKGDDGEAGMTPNIEVGNVETLETGQPAYANITGTDAEPRLNLGLPKGNTGDTGATGAPAGFGTVTATVDANTGTPSVDVTASGADTAKNFDFAFHNIKGETGDTGPQGEPGVVQDVTVNGTSVLDGAVAKVVIPQITKTVTGNPIVIDDADGEVKALNVELTPIQAGTGTPSPTNIRPIYPHTSLPVRDTGKNILDLSSVRGGAFDAASAYPHSNATTGDFVPIIGGQTYIWSQASYPTGGRYIRYYNSEKEQIDSLNIYLAHAYSFTVPTNASYMKCMWFMSNAQFASNEDVEALQPQIELGDTATSYAPYTGQTVTVPLNDLYGGSVDVIGGESGKSTMAMKDLGTLTWSYSNNMFIAYLNDFKDNAGGSTVSIPNAICSAYEASAMANVYGSGDGIFSFGTTSNYAGRILFKDSRYTSAADFSQAMAGVQLCYELATPTPLTTDPTALTLYKGDNVVSSDGDMELTYVRNLQAVIDKIESAL